MRQFIEEMESEAASIMAAAAFLRTNGYLPEFAPDAPYSLIEDAEEAVARFVRAPRAHAEFTNWTEQDIDRAKEKTRDVIAGKKKFFQADI